MTRTTSTSRPLRLATIVAGVAVCAVAGIEASDLGPMQSPPAAKDVPLDAPADGYLGSKACKKCHAQQHASWQASYHRTMTQRVSEKTVLGRFEGQVMQQDGRSYRYLRRDGRFFVQLPDPTFRGPAKFAPTVEKEVVLSTGSHHQQSYWYATGIGRQLALTPFVWLVKRRRWVPYRTVFVQPPPRRPDLASAPEQSSVGLWNGVCSKCHSTHPRPKYGDTDMTEPGIACEACHGPGGEHVAQMNNPASRYLRRMEDKPGETSARTSGRMDPRDMNKAARSAVCGQCHGITRPLDEDKERVQDGGARFRPGKELGSCARVVTLATTPADQKDTAWAVNGYFWRDGQVRVSGREWSAMVRSSCYEKGDLGCTSCHRMHPEGLDKQATDSWRRDQLDPEKPGDKACTQCHEVSRYKTKAHTHHEPSGDGARCVHCHMPPTTWGLLQGIASHEITSPSAKEERETGRPNACNLCHVDRSLKWTEQHLKIWFNQSTNEPLDQRLRRFEDVAAGPKWLLAGDAGVRALGAWAMAWPPAVKASGDGWQAPLLIQAMVDPYAAVRQVAYHSLREMPGFSGFEADPPAPLEERVRAMQAAMAVWQTQLQGGGVVVDGKDAVPLVDGGRRLDPVIDELRKARDDRTVVLLE